MGKLRTPELILYRFGGQAAALAAGPSASRLSSMTLIVAPCTDRAAWDAEVNRLDGHPQQLWGWGQTKADHGWSTDRCSTATAGRLPVRRC